MSSVFRLPCDQAAIRAGKVDQACARAREPWILAASILGSSMAFIDGMIVNLALPRIQSELDATLADAQWIVESYALFLAALILVGGSLGDRYGRRRVFVLGIALFAVASAWCGAAPSVGHLIAARALQGVGGAMLVPGSLALLSASFPADRRGRAIGTWSGFTAISTGLGPILGGWLVESFSWRWAFYVNLPVAALVVAIALWRVPENRDESARGGLDYLGAALSVVGLGALVLGLIEAGTRPFGDPLVWAPALLGVVCLALFVRHERRTSSPMLSLDLFRSRDFSGANLLTLFLYAALSAVFFFLPFNLIQVQGYTPSQAGAAMTPSILITFVLSPIAGRIMDRFGGRLPLTVGPLVAAFGYAMLANAGRGGSYWTTFLPAILVFGAGMAIAVAPLTTVVMGSVSEARAGLASGVNNAVSRTAGLLAIAVMSVVVAGVFNGSLDDRLSTLELSPETAAAMDAQRPNLAAAQPPESVDPALAVQIETAVDDAFVDAFNRVAWIAAFLAALSGVSAFLTIGRAES